jgi:hypothetical protein
MSGHFIILIIYNFNTGEPEVSVHLWKKGAAAPAGGGKFPYTKYF